MEMKTFKRSNIFFVVDHTLQLRGCDHEYDDNIARNRRDMRASKF